jgi:hypothetical protein
MASCGSPTLCPEPTDKCAPGSNRRLEAPRGSKIFAALALAFLSLLVGCVQTVKLATPPGTNQLDTLKLGDSSKADVLLVLGQPQGDGVVRLALSPTPRTIWFYDYRERAGKVIGLNILLVFFDRDKYDGHLWFSSTQELRKAH